MRIQWIHNLLIGNIIYLDSVTILNQFNAITIDVDKSLCCYYWNMVHCLYIHKFWVSELLLVVSSYLQQCAIAEKELDSMMCHVSLEHVTQFVSLASSSKDHKMFFFVPSHYVCSISFFFPTELRSWNASKSHEVAMLLYFCEDCCALPFIANYVLLASYWGTGFDSYVFISQLHTKYHLLV